MPRWHKILGVVALWLMIQTSPASAMTEEELALVLEAERARIAVVDHVIDTVVAVYGQNRGAGGGSGVLIHPDGYALTNFHVVAATGDHGIAGLADGVLYKWQLIGLDPGGDVAVIKLQHPEGKPFKAAKLGNSDQVRVGDFALAMGNPFVLAEDQRPTVTMGVISGIGRYQHGMNDKLLVYGNCIQFDTSINPGNSGGPLFNMAGEVIGINGRGSFEERQRVNVGVGYAISMEQIKNFLPDLLATRVAQHATLDAIFMQTESGPICRSVNTDSAIGRAGLRPGDRLVSFAGHEIRSANHFLNLITTYPANWPVEVVWESRGGERRATVLLHPMRYGQTRDQEAAAPPPGAPRDGNRPQRQLPNRWQEERINDAKKNRNSVRSLMQDWTAFRGGNAFLEAEAIELELDYFVGDRKEGEQRLTLARDGRFYREQRFQDGEVSRLIVEAFDGKTYWISRGGETARFEGEKALRHPTVGIMRTLAHLHQQHPDQHFKKVELTGGTDLNGQRAYRITFEDKHGGKFVAYFSVMDQANEHLQVRLLKFGQLGDDRNGIMTTWSDYRSVDGIAIPFIIRDVVGEGQRLVDDTRVREARVLAKVDESRFAPPAHENSSPAEADEAEQESQIVDEAPAEASEESAE